MNCLGLSPAFGDFIVSDKLVVATVESGSRFDSVSCEEDVEALPEFIEENNCEVNEFSHLYI